ncbi:MAG: polysaccharide pyruvyl transferase family protein [Spirochaetales bacterium]|nr:polysaccharide pyruvyl transferase family protein [Spirochaetales bacterium]
MSKIRNILKKSSLLKKIVFAWRSYKKTYQTNKLAKQWISHFDKNRNKILLALTPEYGNIGDQLIAFATTQFLSDYFPKKQIDELPMKLVTEKSIKYLNTSLYSTVIISGGGYFGSLWFDFEKKSRLIIDYYKNTNIVVFPQTIYYDDNSLYEQKQAIKLYSQCSSLELFIRDNSYSTFIRNVSDSMKTHIYNIPDMAMYLEFSHSEQKRTNITICLRKDKESTNSNEFIQELCKTDTLKTQNINYTDTIVPYEIYPQNRECEIMKKVQEFQESKLVIADRLHAMILCLITGTPCIALNNISKKVEGVWKLWLQDYPYIVFVNQVDEITENLIKKMLNTTQNQYNNSQYKEYWDLLASKIN